MDKDVATRQRAPELDAFDDDRAWGEMGSSASRQDIPRTAPTHASRPEQSNGSLARPGAAARAAWPGTGGAQNQHASAGGRTVPASIRDGDGAPPHGPPSQSKLVQRFFGARGRRGRGGGGGRGRGGGGRSGNGGEASEAGPAKEETRAGAEGSWTVQAELQGKLRELEEEVGAVRTWERRGKRKERHPGRQEQGKTTVVIRCLASYSVSGDQETCCKKQRCGMGLSRSLPNLSARNGYPCTSPAGTCSAVLSDRAV